MGLRVSDGVTLEAIEEQGVAQFLMQIQDELIRRTYVARAIRKKEIPKDGGTKVRVLSIPAIRDRVVQGALKLILEPIFEADFQPGSYGYRPKRTAHQAVNCVAQAILRRKTRIINLDLLAYFDTARHDQGRLLQPQCLFSRFIANFLNSCIRADHNGAASVARQRCWRYD